MVMNTVIMMEMIALTITMMGAMMNRVMRNKMLKKSLKIAMTIKRMIMRNTMSIIVWMIMRKIKMAIILPTGQWYAPSAVHSVILCYTLLYSA